MEDKTFELIEKMYAEMQNGFKKVDDRLGNLENEVKQNTSNIKSIQISLENEIKPKISLCLDELVTVKEKQQAHDKRFDTIESKLEQHDVEISVIKRIK